MGQYEDELPTLLRSVKDTEWLGEAQARRLFDDVGEIADHAADEIERLRRIVNPPRPARKCATCNDGEIITDCHGREPRCPDCNHPDLDDCESIDDAVRWTDDEYR